MISCSLKVYCKAMLGKITFGKIIFAKHLFYFFNKEWFKPFLGSGKGQVALGKGKWPPVTRNPSEAGPVGGCRGCLRSFGLRQRPCGTRSKSLAVLAWVLRPSSRVAQPQAALVGGCRGLLEVVQPQTTVARR